MAGDGSGASSQLSKKLAHRSSSEEHTGDMLEFKRKADAMMRDAPEMSNVEKDVLSMVAAKVDRVVGPLGKDESGLQGQFADTDLVKLDVDDVSGEVTGVERIRPPETWDAQVSLREIGESIVKKGDVG